MGQFLGLAAVNPVVFLGIILGLVLVFAVLLGLAIVVAFVLIAIIGWLLPAMILVLGLYLMTKGRLVHGALLVVLSIAIWTAVNSRVVAF